MNIKLDSSPSHDSVNRDYFKSYSWCTVKYPWFTLRNICDHNRSDKDAVKFSQHVSTIAESSSVTFLQCEIGESESGHSEVYVSSRMRNCVAGREPRDVSKDGAIILDHSNVKFKALGLSKRLETLAQPTQRRIP